MHEALGATPQAARLLDYGPDPASDALVLVLHSYRCSLRQWRAAQTPDASPQQLRLQLGIFGEVVGAAAAALAAGVVHFDLKCDNVLLEPLPGVR